MVFDAILATICQSRVAILARRDRPLGFPFITTNVPSFACCASLSRLGMALTSGTTNDGRHGFGADRIRKACEENL